MSNDIQGRKLHAGVAMSYESGEKIQKISAAAPDFINTNEGHVLSISDYEKMLYDYRLRDFPIQVNMNSVEAMGYPHNFNEQNKIPSNTVAMNPKYGNGSAGTPDYSKTATDTDYGRDNWKKVFVKLYGNSIQYDWFARKYEERYGSFEDLVVKDYNDMIVDFNRVTADAFFNGTSTSVENDETVSLQYCGILKQITDITSITAGSNLFDAINTKFTQQMARLDYSAEPDVIVMHPSTYDILVKQERDRTINLNSITSEIVPGWKVPALNTYVKTFPIMLSKFVRPVADAVTPTKYTHKILMLNQSMIDRIWMFNDGPLFFTWADANEPNANTRLLTNKSMMSYENYVLRGPQTGAHLMFTYDVPVA
jgi:hypothetical protein